MPLTAFRKRHKRLRTLRATLPYPQAKPAADERQGGLGEPAIAVDNGDFR